MFTTRRGSDAGNMLAIPAGLLATVVVGQLHITILNAVAPLLAIQRTFQQPVWIPEVSFTWWAMIGALVVFGVGVFFRTPDQVREAAARHAEEAQTSEDVPLALRECGPTLTNAGDDVDAARMVGVASTRKFRALD